MFQETLVVFCVLRNIGGVLRFKKEAVLLLGFVSSWGSRGSWGSWGSWGSSSE